MNLAQDRNNHNHSCEKADTGEPIPTPSPSSWTAHRRSRGFIERKPLNCYFLADDSENFPRYLLKASSEGKTAFYK